MDYYCDYIKDQETWEQLVKSSNYSGFHQSFLWARFKRMQKADSFKIGLFSKDTKQLVGGCIAIKYHFGKENFIQIPEGPLLDYSTEDISKQWLVLKKGLLSIVDKKNDKTTTHIRIEPRIETIPTIFKDEFSKASYNNIPRNTVVIDLNNDLDTIKQKMKPKGKYNVGLAQKKEVEVTQNGLLEDFYRLYELTTQKNNIKKHSLNYFKNIMSALGGNAHIWVAKAQGNIAAAMIAVYYGERVTYFFGASNYELRSLMSPYLLHFEVIKHAKNHGYKEYDFWGVAPKNAQESHPWKGITRFKHQFGGLQKDFMGAYDWVLDSQKYSTFIKRYELAITE